MQWWHQTVMDIGLNKWPVVVSWYDLKECMRSKFFPPHYKKELLLKLQRLQQGPRSVDEYFKDLETTLTKINMDENEESKIKLVHLAIKVESQLLKKTHFKITHNDDFYKSSWKDKNQIS